ncbi:MAG: HEAT repeat domain-containing protein, partial [Candidatus Neomarinimicrobiota bacterium]
MPRNIVLTVILLWSIGVAEPLVIQPVQKHATAFAIVIDRETYELTKAAVAAYAGAIENDGLSVYTIVDQWEKPEQIRQILFDLYQKKPLLEGVVFIGNIPIPMLRDAQHLTSAFKMRQDRFEWIDTSVPSDRFYDDFDLKFNFLKQDSTQPLLFYYSLDAQSPQTVKRDIYSARIHPPVGDRPVTAVIADYLLRVAEQKNSANRLDNTLVYAGHGYNSESLTAWAGDQLALREQFPHLFNFDGSIRFYYHEMSANMKGILLRELQADDLDLVVFHAHGSEDAQLILGYPPAGAIQQNVEAIKLFVRSKLRQAQRRGQSVEEAKKYYQDSYNLPDEWFAGA